MGSSRFLPTWVEQRRALPLEPVIWEKGGAHETEGGGDASDSDGGDHLAVEVAVVGSEIVSRRLSQLAQQDACTEAFRNRRATGRIELAQKTVLRPCTCGLPIHDAKCPHNWANRYNAMIVAREKERHMKLLQDAIDGRQLSESKKKRSIALAQMSRGLTDVEKVAARLVEMSDQYKFDEDSFVQVPGQCFGQNVYFLKDDVLAFPLTSCP